MPTETERQLKVFQRRILSHQLWTIIKVHRHLDMEQLILGDFWAHLTTCCYQPCWLNSTDQKWSKHRTCSKSVWDTSKDEGIIRDLICAKSINIIQSPLSSLRSMDVSDCFSSRLENRSSKWKIMPRPQGFCSKVQCFVLTIYRLGVWTIMNHRLYI
jgi:hypothetical protein